MKYCFIILTTFLLVFSFSAMAQNKTVTGTITGASDGSVLEGVSIIEKGSTHGVTTDKKGKYSISVPEDAILIISNVGFISQDISVSGRSVIDVIMEVDNNNLDEVVVVGYKNVVRRDVSGSVASIDMKDLQDIPTPSLLSLLAGKAPGVQSIVRTGLPGGAGGGLVVRGNTNLSDASDVTGLSNPLYIVDGVPVSLTDLAGFDVTQNDFFATLNPNDIESIDILKDAAATAIYGSRGANGVVIIKTKRGQKGVTRFNFSGVQGYNFQPSKLKVFIGDAERQEKLRLYNESLKSLFGDKPWVDVRNGLDIMGYMLPPVLTDANNPAFNNAYDYQDLFYRTGRNEQYNLDMSGGSEKSSFRMGLGYYKEKGILVGFDFSRFTLNASLTNDITRSIHNDLSFRLTYLDRRGGQTDNLRSFPTSPTNLPSSLYYKTPEELKLLSGQLGDTYQSNKSYLISISEGLRITILDGLTWDNQFALSANLGREDYFVPSTASSNLLSSAQSSSSGSFTVNAHSILSYLKRMGDHEITVLGGVEENMDQQNLINLHGENGPSDFIQVVQGFQKGDLMGNSDIVKTNMLSYFGNISYGYKDRYKIEGVLRRDGSSRFGENNKWATFPSVKSYWIFSDEPWLESLKDVLTFGKFRVSVGSSGNIDGDPLLQYNSFIPTNNIGAGIHDIYANKLVVSTYGGDGTLISDFNKIANRSLSWSKSTEVDYGIDLEFFNHRLYLTADIYSRYLKGQVFTSQLSSYMGYNSIRSNLVDLISNGWEMNVTGYLFPRDSKIQWDWTLNLAQNKTVVAKLGNGGRDYITGTYAFIEGMPAFQFYTYEYLGVLQDLDDLPVNPMTGLPLSYYGADAGLALNQQGKIFPGMPIFTDMNGDFQVDGGDYGLDKKIIHGKSPEPKIIGGLSTNFKFKEFNLRIQSSFSFGNYIFNTSLQEMLAQYDDNTEFFTNALYDLSGSVDFWEKPGDQAYYPMRYITYSDGGSSRSFRQSSMFIEKGDYWSIDNITLSYNVPKRLSDKLGLRGINIYSTMINAYVWKASKTIPDPRIITKTGYYNGQGYPISRNLVLGLNINF